MSSLHQQVDLHQLFWRTLAMAERKLAAVSLTNSNQFGTKQKLVNSLMLARISCGKLLYLKRWSRHNQKVVEGLDRRPSFRANWGCFRNELAADWSRWRFSTSGASPPEVFGLEVAAQERADVRLGEALDELALRGTCEPAGRRVLVLGKELTLETKEFSVVLRERKGRMRLVKMWVAWPFIHSDARLMGRIAMRVQRLLSEKVDLVGIERFLHGVVLRARFASLVESLRNVSGGRFEVVKAGERAVDLVFSQQFLTLNRVRVEIQRDRIYMTSNTPYFRLPEKVNGVYRVSLEREHDFSVHGRDLYCRQLTENDDERIAEIVEELCDIVVYGHLLSLQAGLRKRGEIPVRVSLFCNSKSMSQACLLVDILGMAVIEIRVGYGGTVLRIPWMSSEEVSREEQRLSRLSGSDMVDCLHRLVRFVFTRAGLRMLGCNVGLSNDVIDAGGSHEYLFFSFSQSHALQLQWWRPEPFQVVSRHGFLSIDDLRFEDVSQSLANTLVSLASMKTSLVYQALFVHLMSAKWTVRQTTSGLILTKPGIEVRITVRPSGYWSISVPTRSSGLVVITGRALTARFVSAVVRVLEDIQSIDTILNDYEPNDNMRSLRRTVLEPLFGELAYEGKHVFVGFGAVEDVIVTAPKSFIKCASLPLTCFYSSVVIPSHVMQAVVAKASSVSSQMQRRVLAAYLGIYHTFGVFQTAPELFKCVIVFQSVDFMFLFVMSRQGNLMPLGVPLGMTDDFHVIAQTRNENRLALASLALSVVQPEVNVYGGMSSIQISPERLGALKSALYGVLPLVEAFRFLETVSVVFNQGRLYARGRPIPDRPVPPELSISAKEFSIKIEQFPKLQLISQQMSRLDLELNVRVFYIRMLSSLTIPHRRQSLREMMFNLLLKLLSPEFSTRVNWKRMMERSVYNPKGPFRVVVVLDNQDIAISSINDTDYFTVGDSSMKLTGDEVVRQVRSDPPLPDVW